MTNVRAIIEEARRRGRKALSEYESKKVLAAYGLPVTDELIVATEKEAVAEAERMGYPVVLKFCGPEIAHKSELGLVEINLRNAAELLEAFRRLEKNGEALAGEILLQAMVAGKREYVLGMTRDEGFGPCVMFGMGGIFTEILKDVTFRVAPLSPEDAREMMEEIGGSGTLGAVRGMEAVDRELLGESLVALGRLALENPEIREIDVNPMIVRGGAPVAVDALVVLG